MLQVRCNKLVISSLITCKGVKAISSSFWNITAYENVYVYLNIIYILVQSIIHFWFILQWDNNDFFVITCNTIWIIKSHLFMITVKIIILFVQTLLVAFNTRNGRLFGYDDFSNIPETFAHFCPNHKVILAMILWR